MDYKKKLAELINAEVKMDIEDIEKYIEIPFSRENGDYSFPCFKLTKALKKPPNKIAEELRVKLDSEYFDKIECVGPYLNIFVDKKRVVENIVTSILKKGDNYGLTDIAKGKVICIQYNSENSLERTCLEDFHSNIIGNSIYNLLNISGYDVIVTAQNEELEYKKELLGLIDKQCVKDKEDLVYGEVNKIITMLKDRCLLTKYLGTNVVMLKDCNLAPCILINSKGEYTYEAKELVNLIYYKQKFKYEKYIYIVNKSQLFYIDKVINVLKISQQEWSSDIVPIGIEKLKFTEKILCEKVVEGVSIEELIVEITKKTLRIIAEINPNVQNKYEVSKRLAKNAIVFTCLKTSNDKCRVFDLNKMISNEGETIVNIQYTYTLANNILRNVNKIEKKVELDRIISDDEFNLIKQLEGFKVSIKEATEKIEPSIITMYGIKVSKCLNKYISSCLELNSKDMSILLEQFLIMKAACQVIKNSMRIIGIKLEEYI